MKILVVSNLYGALARGGAERVVAEETAGLRALGHEVTVVSGDPAAMAGTVSVAADGVREIKFSPYNIAFYTDLSVHGVLFRFWWHYLDIFSIGSANRLAKIIREEKPDVVHTHNLMGLGFTIPTEIRRARIHHVHTVHDVQLLDPSGLLPAEREFQPAWHQKMYIAVMHMMMGSPNVVIFPSDFHMRLHKRLGFFIKSQCIVVRNPAPAFMGVGGKKKNNRIFLFAGQLETHKGIFDLFDAWTKADLKDATLEIAGSGSRSEAVAIRAASMSNVRLLGRLGGSELAAAYERAAWLVLPSRVIENAPASIMEALGRAVPVIASVSGGIPEIVHDAENGYLFPPGDSILLASVLAKAAALDDAAYAQMSDSAIKVSKDLGGRTHIADLENLYH